MKVIILPHDKAVAKYAYQLVMDRLNNGINAIGLSIGAAPLKLYSEIGSGFRRGELDFSGISTFNQTEFLCKHDGEPGSCQQFLESSLFCNININPENIHNLDGLTDDHVRECQFYEDDIDYVGGIKLQIIGLGRNGQIAFNEPGVSMSSRTGFTALSEGTRKDYETLFPDVENIPKYALSMGVGTIMDADECLVLAMGEEMAPAVAATVEGPISAACPASMLQYHDNCTIIIDDAAAANLRYADFYRATMDAEERAIDELANARQDIDDVE